MSSNSVIFSKNTIFEECIEALGPDVFVLSKKESSEMWKIFKNKVPFTKGSRIDFNKVNNSISIDYLDEVIPTLSKILNAQIDTSVFILWNDASVPVIKTTIELAFEHFNDVISVSFETWFFNPDQNYVIEYYYFGEMNLGFPIMHKNDYSVLSDFKRH
ncbi:MAG: hypothetical protein BWY54_00614 [Candidatus Dependentiae bacterium ADurb.Bin331]|nr:MAG: hypothetical protein BWY54_00614 [Candidatus Dependentiae bacterium ADurb.Bin331]